MDLHAFFKSYIKLLSPLDSVLTEWQNKGGLLRKIIVLAIAALCVLVGLLLLIVAAAFGFVFGIFLLIAPTFILCGSAALIMTLGYQHELIGEATYEAMIVPLISYIPVILAIRIAASGICQAYKNNLK